MKSSSRENPHSVMHSCHGKRLSRLQFRNIKGLCRYVLKKWEGSPSKIPWTFDTKETMYLLEGKVKVSCDGYDGSFEIGAGDLVVFPQGMKITWEVIESVKKHYHLEK